MRKLSQITAPIIGGPVQTGRVCDRRPLNAFWASLTTIVLVVHQERPKALYVSDNGDVLCAVWIPRSMVTLDKVERGKFIVATMSAAFANQKRLNVRLIDPARYLPEERIDLQDAIHCAALSRIRMRGNQPSSFGYMGRNAFA